MKCQLRNSFGGGNAFAGILMILPEFLTDFFGIIIIFPWTRKLLFKNIKINKKKEKNFIDEE
jgi:Protein affecting phage T7 exclusion by the F plasmid